jgi:hypothetical protein
MRRKNVAARLFLATSSCALATAAMASETTTYTYDALGRLVATSSSGTVNNGLATGIAYDPAGNRSNYTVTGAAGGTPPPPPPPPPSPPPPPPPPPSGPVANPDSASVGKCGTVFVNVTANDTDPGGHTPLTLIAVSDGGTKGTGSVASATSVEFDSYGPTGTATLTYTIQNSVGATADGTLTVTVTASGTCQ